MIKLIKEGKEKNKNFFLYELDSELVKRLANSYEFEDNKIKIITNPKNTEFLKDVDKASFKILRVKTLEELSKISFEEDRGSHSLALSHERLGLVTGSNNCFTTDGKPIPSFSKYVAQKATERFFSTLQDDDPLKHEVAYSDSILEESRGNKLTDRGHELEPYAIEKFFHQNPQWVEEKRGFLYNRELGLGCSDDTTAINIETFEKAVIEIKNPKMSTYAHHLRTRVLDREYYTQIQLQMVVTGVKNGFLVVNYPRMKQIVTEFKLDEKFLVNAWQTLKRFNEEVGENLKELKEMRDD